MTKARQSVISSDLITFFQTAKCSCTVSTDTDDVDEDIKREKIVREFLKAGGAHAPDTYQFSSNEEDVFKVEQTQTGSG